MVQMLICVLCFGRDCKGMPLLSMYDIVLRKCMLETIIDVLECKFLFSPSQFVEVGHSLTCS